VKSRIAIIHNLANVELWAVDLAWDCIARFSRYDHLDVAEEKDCCGFKSGENGSLLPREFFEDFVRIAMEEAKHHNLLKECLVKNGAAYGDLPTHGRLWESAIDTHHSLICRIAVINMIHEARGLDVNPDTIEKFRKADDMFAVERLTEIHSDEIVHCARGHRWFRYGLSTLCSLVICVK
jgi:uncharacterized ferritin-like protein (DUF455 family)